MADDKSSDAQPAKAQPRKATMAPAARDPHGADDRAADRADARVQRGDDPRYSWLADMDDADLDELTNAIRTERRARGRVAREPSFGMSEGEREELERTGRTVSPFTGEKRGDWSHERGAAG